MTPESSLSRDDVVPAENAGAESAVLLCTAAAGSALQGHAVDDALETGGIGDLDLTLAHAQQSVGL